MYSDELFHLSKPRFPQLSDGLGTHLTDCGCHETRDKNAQRNAWHIASTRHTVSAVLLGKHQGNKSAMEVLGREIQGYVWASRKASLEEFQRAHSAP